jgi:hypothetical protein
MRALDRIVSQSYFADFCKSLKVEQVNSVQKLLDDCDVKGLKSAIRVAMKEELTVRELWQIAKQLGVLNYSRMSKIELLEAINDSDGFTESTVSGNQKDVGNPYPFPQNPQTQGSGVLSVLREA